MSRIGYNTPAITQTDCEVSIVYGAPSTIENNAQLLGTIKLDDTGFSTHCSEKDALCILKKEACSLNANTIVITEFKEPDLANSCYRCSASFYKTEQLLMPTDSVTGNSKIQYAKDYNQSKKPNPMAAVGLFAVGLAISLLLVSLAL